MLHLCKYLPLLFLHVIALNALTRLLTSKKDLACVKAGLICPIKAVLVQKLARELLNVSAGSALARHKRCEPFGRGVRVHFK